MGSAAVARAEAAKPSTPVTPSFTVTTTDPGSIGQLGPLSARKSMSFDTQKGRWGVKLDLDQPTYREMQMKDVEAGAFFRVTPSIRVGGAVNLATPSDDKAPTARVEPPTQAAPRVRLETAFKF